MGSSEIYSYIFLGILIAASAFFSASETALMSLSEIDIRGLIEKKIPRADILKELMMDVDRILSVLLIGNNLVAIGASSIATILATNKLGSAGAGIATGILTVILLIFGEITPKSFSAQNNIKVALRVCMPIKHIAIVLEPVVFVLSKITGFLIKLMGGNTTSNKGIITENELKLMMDVGQEQGVLEKEEHQMISNVFQFGELPVKDIMTPRVNTIGIDINTSYEELIQIHKREHFSRFPVYESSIDNIIGIIYIKDVYIYHDSDKIFEIKDYVRKTLFVPENKKSDIVLNEMRTNKVSMAIVIDEYGGCAGVVTIEDLVEAVVGPIEDEYDTELVTQISDLEYIVDADCRLEYINLKTGSNLSSNLYGTIGGLIMETNNKVPAQGDIVEIDGYKLTVERTRENRIIKIRILKDNSNH